MAGKGAEKLKADAGANIRASIGAGAGLAPRPAPPLREKPRHQVGVSADVEVFKIELGRIMPDPDQPRKSFPDEDIQEMADSLLKNGQLLPIRARFVPGKDRWVIVVGERRYQGALRAKLEHLLVVRDQTTDTTEIRRKQLVENLHRRDLPPVEAAESFRELMELNSWSTNDLARELGINQPRIVQALALLPLPPEIREQVEAGAIKPATAYEISKVTDPVEQTRLAGEVVQEGLSRDATRERVRESVARTEARAATEPAPAAPPATRPGRKVGGKAKPATTWSTKVNGYSIQVERKRGLDPETVVAAIQGAAEEYAAKYLEAAGV